ncbi:putative Leucine repeat containing protein [Rhodotorula toruloides ATCC 204091]|uniref:BY PROTMAP: gi/342320239/gb/EGU12181.1/ putative Leucine repeat containing protein [Rhodotorula glutinis ATCC 204091] n=1 Tax=Rhodotorula toruloides TaxID=5286 RepID=A0A0K3CLQ7_RHOTO|nr:putative Leucine repeat containing protein [Rhodotorula toruloides ATCC 204091]PRQ71831.1 putative leucine repeat-containing protein [Rhodotorula toruloides]
MAHALLCSPATRFSPDSSSDSLNSLSPATPPPPSLDFLSHLGDGSFDREASPTGQFDTPTRRNGYVQEEKDQVPRQSTLKGGVGIELATPQPDWVTHELGEDWIAQPGAEVDDDGASSRGGEGSTTILAPSFATPSSQSPTLLPPSPLPPFPPTTPSYLLRTQPRIPSSLRHAFTAASSPSSSVASVSVREHATDTEAETDTDNHTRDMSISAGSVVEIAHTDAEADDSLAAPPLIEFSVDLPPSTEATDEENDESVGSAGTVVVNSDSVVDRGSNAARGNEQLQAAVRALRGPNAGLFMATEGEAEAEEAEEDEAGGKKAKALLSLFEPPSPDAVPPSNPLPPSARPAPSLSSFTFSPPSILPPTSWRSLNHFSPSPPPPPQTDEDRTPLARSRTRLGTGVEEVDTPRAEEGRKRPPALGRRERFLRRSVRAEERQQEREEEGGESSDDAPFVPTPVEGGTATTTSEDDEDSTNEEEEPREGGHAGGSGPLDMKVKPGLGWSSDEDEGSLSRDDEEADFPSRSMSGLPTPPSFDAAPLPTVYEGSEPASSVRSRASLVPPSQSSLPLPSSPARIPIPSPLLHPPASPLKLFQPTYDTVTRHHLAALVDEIDALSSNRDEYLREGAPAPLRQSQEREENISDEGFLGEEGEKRSSKRIKLSPRSEFASRFRADGEGGLSRVEEEEDEENQTPARDERSRRGGRRSSRSFSISPSARRPTPLRSARRPPPSTRRRTANTSSASSLLSLPTLPSPVPTSPGGSRRRREAVEEAERVMERIRRREEEKERAREGTVVSRVEENNRSSASLSATPVRGEASSTQHDDTSPVPLPHLAAAASASLRSVLGSPAPAPASPSLASSSSLGSGARLPSTLLQEKGGSIGRRHFARTPVGAKKSGSSKASGLHVGVLKGLWGNEAEDADSEKEVEPAPASAVEPEPPAVATPPTSTRHARQTSLTTLHPSLPATQRLLASAGASAREKGLVFDSEQGRWIRTPRRLATHAEESSHAETSPEEDPLAAAQDDEDEEDPFKDFSELRSDKSIISPPAANPATDAAVNLDHLPHAGDGSGSLPRRFAESVSGLGITKGTPPLTGTATSAAKPASSAVQQSPAGACYFSPPPAETRPAEEGPDGPHLVLESEDSATWGRGDALRKKEEAQKLFIGEEDGQEESELDDFAETSMLGLYQAAHGEVDEEEDTTAEARPAPTVVARHQPSHSTPPTTLAPTPATPFSATRPPPAASAPQPPRSALKAPRAQSDPLAATPLARVAATAGPPRSVSFSDGKTSGKIEGLVPLEPYKPFAFPSNAPVGFGSGLKFEMGNGPGSLEFDEGFETQSEVAETDEDDTTITQEQVIAADAPSVRSRKIGEAFESLARGPAESPFAAQFTRAANRDSSLALSVNSSTTSSPTTAFVRPRSRSFTRTHSQNGNATFLTECSFGVSHDRLLQFITDVEPFEPDWEGLRSIDLSRKKVESVVRLKEFLPKLDEVNLNENDISYLTGIPSTLRTLLVSSNRLTSLASFSHLRNLERLDLSNNQLESVHQLACLKHLRELKADGNEISSIEGLAQLDSLVRLSLKSNRLHSVDFGKTKWTRLETLHLARNQIVALHGLEHLVSLTTLNLEHNALTAIEPHADMPKLRVLRLSDNPLSVLDVSFAPKLRTLYADSTRLGALEGTDQLRKLENLSLRDQSGEGLSLSMPHIRDVKRLYLSGNPLPSSFPSEKFFNLVYLELAMCQLTSLPADLASVIPNVRVLNLDYNFLHDLAPLQGLSRLTKLSVVGARLAKARPVATVLASLLELESVDLRMNPFTLAIYPPLVPPSDSLLPSHSEHRILHPDSLPSSIPSDAIADPATHSSAWQALDTKFRRALPDEWYHRRAAYRAAILQSVPSLVRLDGSDAAKERPKLARRVEKLAMRRSG